MTTVWKSATTKEERDSHTTTRIRMEMQSMWLMTTVCTNQKEL